MDSLYLNSEDINNLKKEGLLFDMHFHTNYSDGSVKLKVINKICNKNDIGVAITDHNTIKGILRATKFNFRFIPGIEIRSIENIDILLYFYNVRECEEYYNRIVKPNFKKLIYSGLNIEALDLLDKSKNYNVVSCLPHPFALLHFTGIKKTQDGYINKNKFKDGLGILKKIDAIEILNGHLLKSSNEKAFELAEEFNKAYTAGSDGHIKMDLGKILTYAKSNGVEEFLNAILKKKIKIYLEKGAFGRMLLSRSYALRKHMVHPISYTKRFLRYSKMKINNG